MGIGLLYCIPYEHYAVRSYPTRVFSALTGRCSMLYVPVVIELLLYGVMHYALALYFLAYNASIIYA